MSDMTEKELIELAAKAIGVCDHGEWFDSDDGTYFVVGSKMFDPINDDGDALRLAVKLNLLYTKAFARSVVEHLEDGDDIYLATRRAITRAAAQIGKETE